MNHGHYTSLTSRNMLFAMKKLGHSWLLDGKPVPTAAHSLPMRFWAFRA